MAERRYVTALTSGASNLAKIILHLDLDVLSDLDLDVLSLLLVLPLAICGDEAPYYSLNDTAAVALSSERTRRIFQYETASNVLVSCAS